MSYPDFPPLNWLGYGLDLTTVTPLDITTVSQSVKRERRLIEIDSEEKSRIVNIGGIDYKVPKAVAVIRDISNLDGHYVTYRTGTEATTSFQADASLSIRYLALSGGASASYGISKSFRSDQQFALYSFNSTNYGASLRDYVDYLAEKGILKYLEELASPFPANPSDSVLRAYKTFFDSFGSHVITNTTYGSRFQLNVRASNSKSEVNNKWSVSVQAKFNGVMSGGEFDASVKQESQYSQFEEYMQKAISVQGGDQKIAIEILNKPDDYKKYTDWTHTSQAASNVMGFQTTELWNLMRVAGSSVIRRRANDIQDAFNYITSHPRPFSTSCTLSVFSDWAEFGLVTPSAMIIEDPANPLPHRTKLFGTKVTFGEEHSHKFERQVIKFLIINDGSPIEFYTSHGSLSGRGSKGECRVFMEGKEYNNDEHPDNNWNTKWFYQAPVSSTPAASRFAVQGSARSAKRTWSETLHDYMVDNNKKPDWLPQKWSDLHKERRSPGPDEHGFAPSASGEATGPAPAAEDKKPEEKEKKPEGREAEGRGE